jgi:hypothetical protein
MGRLTRMYMLGLVALVVMAMTATAAFAYTLNADGTGFVGKGEVQTAFGWNNQQLQRNAEGVSFESVVVTERSWTCTNTNNDNTQVRERTTTTTAVNDSIARERNQITGFNLEGYSGTPTSTSSGNQLNSCPSGPWTLTSPAGDPVLVSDELYAIYGGVRVLL